jgi:hypothetical protein
MSTRTSKLSAGRGRRGNGAAEGAPARIRGGGNCARAHPRGVNRRRIGRIGPPQLGGAAKANASPRDYAFFGCRTDWEPLFSDALFWRCNLWIAGFRSYFDKRAVAFEARLTTTVFYLRRI